MAYINCHTHIFRFENTPTDFLNLYLPDLPANLLRQIVNTEAGAPALERIMRFLGKNLNINVAEKYASFLSIGTKSSQKEILEYLMAQYDNPNNKYVGLSVNMDLMGAGNSISGYEGQLRELIEVKRNYPNNVLPFLSVHPDWAYTEENLLSKVKAWFDKKITTQSGVSVYPFQGIKLYPSTGFYPFDKN